MVLSSEHQSKNRRLIQELLAILTVMIPAIGYISAYLFEIGYCQHFSIPLYLINLDLTFVVLVIGITIIFLIVALLVLIFPLVIRRAIRRISAGKVGPVWIRIITACLYLLITVLLAIQHPLLLYSFPVLLGCWVLIELYDFLGPLITHRGRENYREKLLAHDAQAPGFLAGLTVGKEIILLGIVLLLMVSLSYLEGTKIAATQKEFLVPASYPGYAVLRIYGDNIICVAYTDDKHVKKEFTFLYQRQLKSERYTLLPIGPLSTAGE
jgi:hypothetical protein